MIKYIIGNLFDSKNSMAHYVSADFKMGAGIAKTFRKLYIKEIDDAVKQNGGYPKIGKCIVAKIGDRYVFNLVTKAAFWQKPRLDSVETVLIDMFNKMIELKINVISIPKIGCGLDKLKWNDVKRLIKKYQGNILVEVFVMNNKTWNNPRVWIEK